MGLEQALPNMGELAPGRRRPAACPVAVNAKNPKKVQCEKAFRLQSRSAFINIGNQVVEILHSTLPLFLKSQYIRNQLSASCISSITGKEDF